MGKEFSLRYINTKTYVLLSGANTRYFDRPYCAEEALYDTPIMNKGRRY